MVDILSALSEVDDESYDKALGQFRLALNDLMQPLRRYGQDVYVDGAKEELVQLALRLHMRLCGQDIPYEVEHRVHW